MHKPILIYDETCREAMFICVKTKQTYRWNSDNVKTDHDPNLKQMNSMPNNQINLIFLASDCFFSVNTIARMIHIFIDTHRYS